MKKLLPIIKNVITKSSRSFSAVVLLLLLLGITKSTQAQVYYLINSTTGNTSNAANALKKVDYTGSNDGNVTTGIPNPILAEVDAPNNRVFTYNGFLGNRVINVVNMSTGGVINTITLPAGIQVSGPSVTAIKYDPINDWVYYVTNSNGGSATLNAVYRSKPDGTQNAALATGIATLPQWLALDIPNNRVFIYEGVFSGRKILTFDLGTNTVTGNAPVSNIANAIAYDPITDYLYYITSDNDQINAGTANDALRKIRPGGSGGEIVIKSSLVKSPQYMALDAGNNRAFVYNGYYGSSTTIRLDDTGIYSVDLTTGATTRILDHSGLQNTPNYLRVYALFAPARPNVSTTAVSTFSSASATLGGNVTRSDASVTERGVVYSSSNTTPTIGGSGVTKATIGTGTGSFSQSISGLSPSTAYYVRSYATSGAGTTYGTVTSFTTQSNDANLSAFTISAGTLTPGFLSGTISYTASVANANSTITVTPTKNNANASIKVNTVVVNSGSASGVINLNIGDNVITTVVTAQDGTTTKTYTLTVNRPKAAQTITFAGTATKTYGDADFAPGASASSGLGVSYSSDNLGVATIVSGQIHIVGAGTANITASQAGDGNYLAASNVVQALTVNKASQTITFNTIPAKTYGIADFAPGATSSAGLTVSYSSDNSLVATIVSNQIHIVGQGTANITASQSGDANRLAATNVAQILTVNKATVTVTANAQTKIYGDNDPTFTYTATGVVGTDAPTGVLNRVTPNTNRFIGTYAIDQGTLSYGGNYTITYTGANLTINKRPITVLPSAKTKVYGDADPFLNQFATPAGSLAPGDATADQFGRAPGESVGTYLMTLGNKKFLTDGGTVIVTNNYDITVQPANFTITAKPVIVSANAQTKTYGDADPTLSYVNDSLPFGDTFSGSLTRAPGEGFGTYAITQGTLALSSNYTLTFNGNSLAIGKKTINVTANAKTKTYGTADPAFDYTYDALSFSDGFTGTLTRDGGEGAGNHAITQGSLALSSNYTINYTGANLSIGKATLTYVAAPASRPYQTVDPTYTGSVTGFVSGDNLASTTSGTLSFATTATLNSGMGNYPIVGSGLSATNYDFVQDASNATALTITASVDATLAGLSVDQGTLSPVFSSDHTSYGFSVANNVASFNLTATVNQQNASININGATVTSGSAKNIALNTGNNNINVIVTAQDGSTTKYYTLNIFRGYDTNNLLAGFNLSGLTYSPVFDTNTLNYTASVGNTVTSTDVTATAVSPTTHIFVGGYDLATTNPVTTTLNVGETDVILVSKAENGDERIYKVTVTRAQSSDATLASIGNNTITLNTPFVSGTHTYSATVAASVGSLTFLPTTTNNMAFIKINNQNLNIGVGNNVNLSFGPNAVTIDVTSEDGTNHIAYVVSIYRLRSSDATLANLSFPSITALNEEFNPNVFEYTATVADSTYTGIPLSAVSANENAIVKIDGTVVPRFQNYTLPVHGGPNTYHVVVTSQDTSATKTYTLVLTRAGTPPPAQSPVANLNALNVNATGFSKNFNFTTGDVLTTINVPNSIAAVRVFAVSENMVSTVTVNGVTLPYDTTTDLLPISLGDNLFTVVVTSEDGAHSKTYNVHVNRLPFADVTLVSLTINKGTLTPAFVPGTRSYNVSVPNTVDSLIVTPVATVNTATIQIGATTISALNPSAKVHLNTGLPNNIRVVVTAADGVTKQTYTITANRAYSDNASADLTISPKATLVKTSSTITEVYYSANVAPEVTSVTLSAIPRNSGATMQFNGSVLETDSETAPITLNVSGPTVLQDIVVTAENGVNTRTYHVTINRPGSNVANLTSLKLTPTSTLVKGESSITDVDYTATVAPDVSSVMLTGIVENPNSTIKVNGVSVASGAASAPVAISVGGTVINLVVTAQDGVSTRTYHVTVNRTGSNIANATSIKLTPASMLVKVSSTLTDVSYTTTVAPDLTTVILTAIPEDANSTMKVNGVSVTSGAASAPIALNVDETVVNLVVTAQDGITTRAYHITVSRTGSSIANATALRLTPTSTLVKVSSTLTDVNYTCTVAPDISDVMLTAFAQDLNSTMTINGIAATSGIASDPIALNVGPTVIDLVVTAQDGVTTRGYHIEVNRTGSNIANATIIRLTPASTLVKGAVSSAEVSYSSSVATSTASVTLTATAQDPNSTMTVNGATVTSGSPSAPITLAFGQTVVELVVTAQDGVTQRTYNITLTRPGGGMFAVNRDGSKLLFANKTSNNVAPTDNDGVVVHQGVSPNGDGANDFLYIEGISAYAGNKLSIMNTSGSLVFETKDYGKDGNNLFNGHSNKNGTLLKPGTYYYALEYQVEKQNKRKTGYIIIKY
jgi:gliding motility-associated-like protein